MADHLSMKVILSIRCKQLKDLDTFSKSDPYCIVRETTKGLNKVWGQTETMQNNLNPVFKKSIEVPYFFEKQQIFMFEINDDDGNGQFDRIGTISTTMGAIMGAKQQCLVANLLDKNQKAGKQQIIITAEGVSKSNEVADISMRWENLNNKQGCLCLAATVPTTTSIER